MTPSPGCGLYEHPAGLRAAAGSGCGHRASLQRKQGKGKSQKAGVWEALSIDDVTQGSAFTVRALDAENRCNFTTDYGSAQWELPRDAGSPHSGALGAPPPPMAAPSPSNRDVPVAVPMPEGWKCSPQTNHRASHPFQTRLQHSHLTQPSSPGSAGRKAERMERTAQV